MRHASATDPLIYQHQSQTAPNAVAGAVFALIGGALIVVGTLLPWVTERDAFALLNRNAFQLGPNLSVTFAGPVVLAFGALSIVIGIVRLLNSSMPRYVQGSTIVTGLVSGAIIAYNYPVNSNRAVITTVAYGYWICAVGAGLAFLGGVMMRRPDPRSRVRWLTAAVVVVALLVIGAGTALGVHLTRHSGPAPISLSTVAANQDAQTVATGCHSAGLPMSDVVSEAADERSTQPLRAMDTGTGSDWAKVTAMQMVGGDSKYRPVANATTALIEGMSSSIASGNLTAVEDALTNLGRACSSLGGK